MADTEIKQDQADAEPRAVEPQDDIAQFKGLLREYGQPVLIGLGLALAIFLGFGAYRNYKTSAAMRASQMLMGATSPEQIQQVANQYASTPVAPVALLSLAAIYFDAGQYDLARSSYQQFEEKYAKHPMIEMALIGKAQCLEAEGQLEQALEAFSRFAADRPKHFLAPLAVMGKGRCLTQLGKLDEARVVYEDYVAANPEGSWTPIAESALLFVDKEARAKAKGIVEPPPVMEIPITSLLDPAVLSPSPSPAPSQVPSPAPATE